MPRTGIHFRVICGVGLPLHKCPTLLREVKYYELFALSKKTGLNLKSLFPGFLCTSNSV